MIEFITALGIDPGTILSVLLLATAIFILLYRPFVFNLFDPLCLFIMTMVANSALMFCLPWDASYKWQFAFFSLALWVGFAVSGNPKVIAGQTLRFSSDSLFELEIVLAILFITVVVGNLYLGLTAGFPIFADVPSEAKVTSFTGGLGLIRRINMGPYVFFCSGCMYLVVNGHRRRLALVFLGVSTICIALSGSKSALLPLVFALIFIIAHPGVRASPRLIARTRRYTPPIFGAGILVALIVSAKDQGSVFAGLLSFTQRLLLSGDVILFYFADRPHIMSQVSRSLFGYLQYLSNDTLSMIRLAEHREALGSIILNAGDNGFGPNAQFFIRADLFFGPIAGVVYCLLLGYCIGWLRKSYFQSQTRSPIWFVFQLSLASSALLLATESALFASLASTIVLVVFPLWGVAWVVKTAIRDPFQRSAVDIPKVVG